MVILVIVIIIILAVALSAIGAWIVIQGRNEQDHSAEAPIDRSGSYAVLRHSIRDDLDRVKPSMNELESWLRQPERKLNSEQVKTYLDKWKSDVDATVATVEEGDRERISTFRVLLAPKDRDRCPFLHADNFLTREQIQNHPQLLPPYYPGCDSRLVLKQPWDNPSKAGWKSVIPQDGGSYAVPDWRQLA